MGRNNGYTCLSAIQRAVALGDLEKCWWENGTPKLFSPNVITLAEKSGFNAER
jgi:hypothetical protein